jgi:hypothetical protein
MEEPKVIRRGTQTPEQSVFGHDYTVQPITKMPLERGSGALPDDLQAQNVHLPTIWQMQGQAVHDLVAADLKKYRQEKYDAELEQAKAKRGQS